MRTGSIVLAAASLAASAAVTWAIGCSVSDNTSNITCPTYCQQIMATCLGDAAQYPTDDNNATCLNVCKAWEAGVQGQQGQDTVACRNVAISNAKEDPPAMQYGDCIAAGISSNVCPGDMTASADPNDQCVAFCQTALTLCGSLTHYEGGVPECVTACKGWDQQTFNGFLIGTTGNNLECRTYHLELSQSGNPTDFTTHCPHTGTPSAKCFDTPPDAGSDAPTDAPTDAPSGG